LETSFSWLSDDVVRLKIEMGVVKKCTKMSTPFPVDFPYTTVTPQHAVVIDDFIIIGRRRIYCASILLGRCLSKRVDVYIITLSCTWPIYALSERLLVVQSGARQINNESNQWSLSLMPLSALLYDNDDDHDDEIDDNYTVLGKRCHAHCP